MGDRELDGVPVEVQASRSPRLPMVAAAVLLIIVTSLWLRAVALMAEPGDRAPEHWVMRDYRDTIYYPVVSFLHGGVPYDADAYMARYPVAVAFPPYPPLHLLVHLPFGLMPQLLSQWLFFGFSMGLTFVLAYVVLRLCFQPVGLASLSVLSALLFASRPGHWSLLLGQPTVELVLAVYVALYASSRAPWVSGFALAVATMKPTFGVPLAALMMVNKPRRSVAIGVAVAVLGTLVATAVLANSAGGVSPLIESLRETYVGFGNSVGNSPVLCPTRIDAIAFISRLLGRSLGIWLDVVVLVVGLALSAAAVWRVRRVATGREADLFSIATISVAILLVTYQQHYSALLLVLPLTALALDRWAPPALSPTPAVRFALIALLAVPATNYLSSWTIANLFEVGSGWWRLIVSINSGALLGAFAIYVALALGASATKTRVGGAPTGRRLSVPDRSVRSGVVAS